MALIKPPVPPAGDPHRQKRFYFPPKSTGSTEEPLADRPTRTVREKCKKKRKRPKVERINKKLCIQRVHVTLFLTVMAAPYDRLNHISCL